MTEPAAEREASAGRAPLALMIGPGLLLAATGVGGGDLATGSLAGSIIGPAVLWAVVAGALLKYVVTEGLARWQLSTGETFLEGVARRAGRVAIWLFLPYLLLWSFFVGSAQMSASGVALHAAIPLFDDAERGRVAFGIAAGLVGLGLVWRGGYRLFEIVMRICIGVMFVTVLACAAALWPGTGAVLGGLFVPTIPDADGQGLAWTLALLGGVGGTLTVLCYGYWLREERVSAPEDLRRCRIDLGTGYVMTALFGIAMVIVGASVSVDGSGAELLVDLAAALGGELGAAGRWLFLVGTLGAVLSSLLGVWQAVPYLFADCWRLIEGRDPVNSRDTIDTRSAPYRIFLAALAVVPMAGLFFSFRDVQLIYTVIGALFFPVLALGLLIFNSRSQWVGALRTRPLGLVALIGVLGFFSWMAVETLKDAMIDV